MIIAAITLGGIAPALIGYWVYAHARSIRNPSPGWTGLYITSLFYGAFILADQLLWNDGVIRLYPRSEAYVESLPTALAANLTIELASGLCGILFYLVATDLRTATSHEVTS